MTSCILRGLCYEDLAFSGGFGLPAPPSRRVRFGQHPYVGSSFHLLQLCNPPQSCPPWMLQHLAIVVCNQVAHNARPARRRVVARPRKERGRDASSFSATSMGPLYEALCSGVHPFSALALMSALSASGLSAIPVHKSRALCAPAPRLLLQLQRLAGIERKDEST